MDENYDEQKDLVWMAVDGICRVFELQVRTSGLLHRDEEMYSASDYRDQHHVTTSVECLHMKGYLILCQRPYFTSRMTMTILQRMPKGG